MKILRTIIIYLLMFVTISTTYPIFIMNIEVVGDSMNPTYKDGQEGYCSKIIYRLERFDVIIVDRDEKDVIKRVIGLPNETIRYDNNTLYIDDKIIGEDFITNEIKQYTLCVNSTYCNQLSDGIKLDNDEYFIMGDNRRFSVDSRTYGPIKKDMIIGEVFGIK